VALILSAILSLAPWLPRPTARTYAQYIRDVSERTKIHPFLFVAFATVESSWNPDARSSTGDWGLFQVHVAKRGSARFLGRERELLKPAVNTREWGRIASMWRAYHDRTCKPGSHRWWAHLKYGYLVKDEGHAMIVGAIFDTLIKRFKVPARGET